VTRWTLAILVLVAGTSRATAQTTLDAGRHHLGVAGAPEWQEFADEAPEGPSLTVAFPAVANAGEATLLIRQRDVKLDWPVRLNGRVIGRLLAMEAPLVHALPVPPGALRDGRNTLVIGPSPLADDIVIECLSLDPRPLRQALGGATLDVAVTEAGSGAALPCRITVVDEAGALAALTTDPGAVLAARAGVVYTPDGRARIGLRPGRYTVHATRGFEYGLATASLELSDGQPSRVALAIGREVPTPGLVACDTHIHTLTHSGHGDATLDERAITLAGEGIELPVATDHDHLTDDLGDAAARVGVAGRFTPVVGDEVTTRVGHFNAFPFAPGTPVPDPKLDDWGQLLAAIRAGSDGRVVILNHPRDIHAGFRPFDAAWFHPVTGRHARGRLGVDAIEVVNSGAMQSDPLRLVRDWWAVLNHGERVAAVGASDSHDVARFIVGQGRTYLACPDDDSSAIDVARACRALREGRASVSLGLLVWLTVDDRFGHGDLATGLGDSVRVSIEVLGPSWTRADRLELYANGALIREAAIDPSPDAHKARITWTLPRPPHDQHLVAVATGPGVTAPYWAIARPYQPTSRSWTPRVLGVTNPIYLDGDGDGTWSCARSYADALIKRVGTEPTALLPALGAFDEAVAAQAAGLCDAAGIDLRDADWARRLDPAAAPVRRGFAAYAAARRPP
jgi:hypothetical protein